MENAAKICQKLKQEGNEIYFITARLTIIPGCDSKTITEESFKKYKIPYNQIIMNASDKLPVCQKLGIELFIEDSLDTCQELSENGIKSILMTTRMNQKINSEDIIRVYTWNEIYNEIHNMLN